MLWLLMLVVLVLLSPPSVLVISMIDWIAVAALQDSLTEQCPLGLMPVDGTDDVPPFGSEPVEDPSDEMRDDGRSDDVIEIDDNVVEEDEVLARPLSFSCISRYDPFGPPDRIVPDAT